MSENAKSGTDQYGRKTWDVEAFAKKANKNNRHVGDEPTKDNANIVADKSSSHMVHREKLIKSLVEAISKYTLINPNNTQSRGKNRRFGFACPVCLLTFRDNMSLIDHFNSPQHIQKVTNNTLQGEEDDDHIESEPLEGGIRHATVEEVESMLNLLLERRNNDGENKKTMQQRIEARKEFEQRLKEKKKLKKQRKKQKKAEQSRPIGFIHQ